MTEFEFYKSKELYREKYYQMPKVFFTNEKYIYLSNDAKIAYMLLKDRFDFSVQNEWVDSEDNIYFIFTVSQLMDLLNCREGKISKIKKELVEANLLRQKKGRVKSANGKIESTPNLLYLGKPEVTAEDVYRINESIANIPNPVIAKIAITEKARDTSDNSVIAKIANTEKVNDTNDNSVIAKIADNQYNSFTSYDTYNDTKDIDTPKQLTDVQLERQKLESISATIALTYFKKGTVDYIAKACSKVTEAYDLIDIIHKTKSRVEWKQREIAKEIGIELPMGIKISGERFNSDLDKTVKRFLNTERNNYDRGKKITEREKYFRTTMLTFWQACLQRQLLIAPYDESPLDENAQYDLVASKKRSKGDMNSFEFTFYTNNLQNVRKT